MPDWIGYQWLAARYGVSPVQAFRTDSAIAKSRATARADGYVHEDYPLVDRSLSDLGSVGCEVAAAVHSSPSSRPIAGL